MLRAALLATLALLLLPAAAGAYVIQELGGLQLAHQRDRPRPGRELLGDRGRRGHRRADHGRAGRCSPASRSAPGRRPWRSAAAAACGSPEPTATALYKIEGATTATPTVTPSRRRASRRAGPSASSRAATGGCSSRCPTAVTAAWPTTGSARSPTTDPASRRSPAAARPSTWRWRRQALRPGLRRRRRAPGAPRRPRRGEHRHLPDRQPARRRDRRSRRPRLGDPVRRGQPRPLPGDAERRAGHRPPGAGLGQPFGITIGADGRVYAAASASAELARVDAAGHVQRYATPGGSRGRSSPAPTGTCTSPTSGASASCASSTARRGRRRWPRGRWPTPPAPSTPRSTRAATRPRSSSTTAPPRPTARPRRRRPSRPASGRATCAPTFRGSSRGRPYHVRVRASNAEGSVTGADVAFTTPKPKPTPVRATVAFRWGFTPSYTILTRVLVRQVARKDTIKLTCKGRGCGIRSRRCATRGQGQAHQALRRGAAAAQGHAVRLRITAPDRIGSVTTLTVRRQGPEDHPALHAAGLEEAAQALLAATRRRARSRASRCRRARTRSRASAVRPPARAHLGGRRVAVIVTSSTSSAKSSASRIALSSSTSQLEPAAAIASRSSVASTSSQSCSASRASPADWIFSTWSATAFSSPSKSVDEEVLAPHPATSAARTSGSGRRRGACCAQRVVT